MKIEYQKQAQGSFLILGEMEQASAFFLQMLAENEISGLFPCSLQNFNGEKRLSYAVCGSSLETFAKRQALTATDIQTFFTALYLFFNLPGKYPCLKSHSPEKGKKRTFSFQPDLCFDLP